MVNHRLRIVYTDDTFTAFLEVQRGFPRLIDVLSGVILEDRDVFTDVVTVGVFGLEEGNGGIDFPVLVKECCAREPHPVRVIKSPISI